MSNILFQKSKKNAKWSKQDLYADDVVIFLQPSANDIRAILDILQQFGEASGLKTNVQKAQWYLSVFTAKPAQGYP